MKRGRPLLVTVVWTDAVTIHESWRLDEVMDHADLKRGRETSGWLVGVDAEMLVLAQDYDADDDECGTVTVIPMGWIERIRTARGRLLYVKEARPGGKV